MFGVEPYLVETFVNTDKYWGTCYRAAFFRYLGETRGFSKEGKTFIYHGHRKASTPTSSTGAFKSIIEACPRHYRTPKVRERVVNMQLAKPDWNPKLLDDVGLGPNQVPELGGLLNDFRGPFRDCYVRSDQREDGEAFVKGFLFRPRPEVDSHRSPLLMINTPG